MDSELRVIERARIGALIRLFRHRKGLSLDELASCVDISSNNLSRIERGKYAICIDMLNRIVCALDCTVMIIPNDLIYEFFGKD